LILIGKGLKGSRTFHQFIYFVKVKLIIRVYLDNPKQNLGSPQTSLALLSGDETVIHYLESHVNHAHQITEQV
jgi:hypothetical protein